MKILSLTIVALTCFLLLFAVGLGIYTGETYVPARGGGYTLLFSSSPIPFSLIMLFYGSFGLILLTLGIRMLHIASLILNGDATESAKKKTELLIKALDLEVEGRFDEAKAICEEIGFTPNTSSKKDTVNRASS